MTAHIEVRVAELIGRPLDWAVAQVVNPEGFVLRDATREMGCWVMGIAYDAEDPGSWLKSGWAPSTDWSVGGPLIEKHRISFEDEDDCFSALLALERPAVSVGSAFGSTHLIAACRAIVAAKLGETVTVPADLVQAVQP